MFWAISIFLKFYEYYYTVYHNSCDILCVHVYVYFTMQLCK